MRIFLLHIATLLIGFFLSSHISAQEVMPIAVKVGKVAYEGDSIPHITLPTLHKYPHFTFKNDRARNKYNRLVFNIKKVLPIAKLVRATIIETYELLQMLPEDQRAAHLKRVEQGLFDQYGKQMRKLTRTQGRLLVKLVDRECNNSGYAITKAFLGVVRANLYQGIALCFGNSLTKRYDPEGEDKEVERIVLLIESGQL
ncbi:MAG: DUF4294 domain-containing protein [Bacteroidaceae bacterium]|nr:DUF4294 domain-containing protein [Bacteroidaceae bacterium]